MDDLNESVCVEVGDNGDQGDAPKIRTETVILVVFVL